MERPPTGMDKPIMIGEFHFGALDRGLFHPGLRWVRDQGVRAQAYTFYMKQALLNDYIVGAHWYEYRDMMVSGKSPGPNYQVGFTDIADRPYPEMIAASKKVGSDLYTTRYSGGVSSAELHPSSGRSVGPSRGQFHLYNLQGRRIRSVKSDSRIPESIVRNSGVNAGVYLIRRRDCSKRVILYCTVR